MSSLFAPPELLSAYAMAEDGSGPDLPFGTHLRIFAGSAPASRSPIRGVQDRQPAIGAARRPESRPRRPASSRPRPCSPGCGRHPAGTPRRRQLRTVRLELIDPDAPVGGCGSAGPSRQTIRRPRPRRATLAVLGPFMHRLHHVALQPTRDQPVARALVRVVRGLPRAGRSAARPSTASTPGTPTGTQLPPRDEWSAALRSASTRWTARTVKTWASRRIRNCGGWRRCWPRGSWVAGWRRCWPTWSTIGAALEAARAPADAGPERQTAGCSRSPARDPADRGDGSRVGPPLRFATQFDDLPDLDGGAAGTP